MKWVACELHTHTFHSDGRQSLAELAAGAKDLGFDCIALTDHNTMTGLAGKEEIERETGLSIISGMEWTTFFGHMVTIGLDEFLDWRPVGPGDIHAGLSRVHERGGLAGMAHPFRAGSPMCTGCYWEFEISDWNDIDYIEVWSTTFAPVKNNNIRAFRLWTEKLNEGYRIAATSGRDWHHQDPTDDPLSVTYLQLEEGNAPITAKAVRALSAGRASVTLGPLLELEVTSRGTTYGIGSAVPGGRASGNTSVAAVSADFQVRKGHWKLEDQRYTLKLDSNNGILAEEIITSDAPRLEAEIPDEDLLWIRAELWGMVNGVRTIIAFTNAVYFD
ncbi:CehA/McbA family metallohydrolase [Paenibacillus sp. NPDC057934]|uniref:CehA/McbA family metallohydrolase n=1 Tax=Paenibacillus sp. NPDC057934 TaxID=3346282 RepID=UPI0036DC89F0